jgi:hypothetical protein
MEIFRLWLRAAHLDLATRTATIAQDASSDKPRIFRLFMTPGTMWATPSAGRSQQIHSSQLLARFHAAAHRRSATSSSRGRLGG